MEDVVQRTEAILLGRGRCCVHLNRRQWIIILIPLPRNIYLVCHRLLHFQLHDNKSQSTSVSFLYLHNIILFYYARATLTRFITDYRLCTS